MKSTLMGVVCLTAFAHIAGANPIQLSTGTASYTITSDTNGGGDGTTVFPITTLAPGWLANPVSDGIGDTGVWIGPNAVQKAPDRSSANGSTTYETTFSMVSYIPSTAVLTMNLFADDYVTVKLNGHTIFTPSAGQKSAGMWGTPSGVFTVTDAGSFFTAGINVLDFVVPNYVGDGSGQTSGPTGLAVAASVFAVDPPLPPAEVPEPASLAMMGTGLGALGWFARRRAS